MTWSIHSLGQSYGLAVGLRLGNSTETRTLGLTGAYRIFENTTIEGIVQTNFTNEYTAHLLIRGHRAFLTKRLNLFFGAGMSLGNERSRFVDEVTRIEGYTVDNATIGVDLMAGMELTLLKYAVSMDVKPNFNIAGRVPWVENQIGISVRPVIISGAAQNKKRRVRERSKRRKEREKRREERGPLFGDWFQDLFD